MDVPKEILNAPIRFWTCIVSSHRNVEWVDGIAHCLAEGCEVTSEDTERYLDLFREIFLCPVGSEIRAWRPEDGDQRCQLCGVPNVTWFTDSDLWNRVMPRDGIRCIPCFIRAAEAIGINHDAWWVGPQSRMRPL